MTEAMMQSQSDDRIYGRYSDGGKALEKFFRTAMPPEFGPVNSISVVERVPAHAVPQRECVLAV